MLQVDKAYEHLVNYADAAERNVRFAVSCSDRLRGIYLREAHQTSKPSEHIVTVEPKHRETDAGLSSFYRRFLYIDTDLSYTAVNYFSSEEYQNSIS